MEKEYINPNNPVYFSYAWADDEHPNIEKDVENLCEVLESNHIYYKQDKKNLCPYRWSIQKAEEEIGEGTAIIVVISERYLKSMHCMNEWHRMRENGKIWEHVFPIVLESGRITNKDTFKEFYKFFKDRADSLLEQQNEMIIPLTRVETEAANAGYYIDDLKKMYQYLAENNSSKLLELRKDNYEAIIGRLKDFLINIRFIKYSTKEVKNNIENDRSSFKQGFGMENKYINPNNPVYISYAWANDEHPDIEDDVNNLCNVLEEYDIYYKRDKINLCNYRWCIHDSEIEIGEGAAIIVVISERYLKSLHCMNEWHLMRENGKMWEHVFPIVLESGRITNKDTFKEFYKFFKDRADSLLEQQNEMIIPLTRVETEAANAGYYIDDLKKMYQYLAENNSSKLLELRKDNYEAIIGRLKDFLINNRFIKYSTKEVKYNIENDRLSFKQDAPIYISYAHAEKGKEKIAVVVDFIRDVFEKESIKYRIDEDIEGGEHITDFEREIGNSKYTIIVYNEKYFCSPHCMYEFKQIKNATKNKKIICINSDSINLEKYEKIQELFRFWSSIESDIEFKNPKYLTQIEKETLANKYYKEDIKELRDYFGEKKHYNINEDNKLTKQDTEHLINTVKKWFPKNSES